MAMGCDVDDHHEPHSTPKLTLSKFPYSKPIRYPPQMRTPPPRSPASIPFRWEEAPGKPRAAAGEETDGRCLDLPPRLKSLYDDDDSEFTVMPSPTTVLDGPYVGRSLSLACTFSFRRGPVAGREDAKRIGGGGGGKVGSRRWGSFRDEKKKKLEKGNLDFSCSLGDLFRSEKNVKGGPRARKRKGFFGNLPGINSQSHLWGDMYASLKQAVPVQWRSRAQPMNGKKERSNEM